jgi:hypothetical protein
VAFYKWLVEGHAGREPAWPEPNVWSEPVKPRVNEDGYLTIVGAHVCILVPAKIDTLPAKLWKIDVDGEYDKDTWGTVWEKVKLEECYGSMLPDQGAEMALCWAKTQFDFGYLVPRNSSVAEQFDKLEAGEVITHGAGYTPLTMAIRATEKGNNAWAYAHQIALHCSSKDVLLEMARRTVDRLHK